MMESLAMQQGDCNAGATYTACMEGFFLKKIVKVL